MKKLVKLFIMELGF